MGQMEPASSCHQASVALSKPPSNPPPGYLFAYLLCGQGEVAAEPFQEFPQGEISFSFLVGVTEELEGYFQDTKNFASVK